MAPDYWQSATQDLSRSDPVMAALIEKYSGLSLVSRGDPFSTLARSIVGQQISVKAADAVWGRFVAVVGTVEPNSVVRLGKVGLAGCGLSQRKIEYLCDLARHFSGGQLNPAEWHGLDDETLIQELCAVRGIGRWTAEMFLIFNQMRPDIFPVDDLGVQRAVREHYFEGEKQPPRQLAEFAKRWQPWRTVATWYLWRSLDPVPVEY
ncbi:DNA-3-methyladenine glycosylase family protein [Azonexus sp. IMCC34839]|uniref:DNA-3-methyladenine glycosylase family protein n=1 Tax=Azonexus sp. IMCC34839 TaxID=3133695 RepID=UPI003999FB2F